MKTAVIVDSVRTGLAKSHRGGFNITRADDMLAHIINAMLERNPNLAPEMVEDIIMGCGNPEGPMGHNIGRNAAVLSNLPVTTGGTTVNRYCSSGLQTVSMAASQIMAGCYDTIIAGGVEQITMLSGKQNMEGFVNDKLLEELPGIYLPMGITAETVAKRYKVSRETQDEIAFESQKRTAAAQEAGKFADEIISMATKMLLINKETGDSKEVDYVVEKDECNRPGTTMEALAGLKPVFDPENGSVTAGNSSGLNDGSAAMLLASEKGVKENKLSPIAKIVSSAVVGVEPKIMGIGPVKASNKALEKAGLTMNDMDIIELNEAFSAQALACIKEWGLEDNDPRINPNGGAIALGHPLGVSGTRILQTAAIELQKKNKKYALATMCIGVGQGYATIIKRV